MQTSAPSSMNATLARAARAGAAGSSAVDQRLGRRRWSPAPASAPAERARATSRRTLVSTTGWRWPYANAATARAV